MLIFLMQKVTKYSWLKTKKNIAMLYLAVTRSIREQSHQSNMKQLNRR
tara:strand:+ start:3549 stop:3692 length:144 start_codon:yes stop_codon:yes gene_type:complete